MITWQFSAPAEIFLLNLFLSKRKTKPSVQNYAVFYCIHFDQYRKEILLQKL